MNPISQTIRFIPPMGKEKRTMPAKRKATQVQITKNMRTDIKLGVEAIQERMDLSQSRISEKMGLCSNKLCRILGPIKKISKEDKKEDCLNKHLSKDQLEKITKFFEKHLTGETLNKLPTLFPSLINSNSLSIMNATILDNSLIPLIDPNMPDCDDKNEMNPASPLENSSDDDEEYAIDWLHRDFRTPFLRDLLSNLDYY